MFFGNVNVLSVTGTKNFKIDHPVDPGNKYLLHASVESSEVLNVYSGNVVTDARGRAVVALPEWFEALNSNPRYQLTVIGRFAQAIVARKVENNRFEIRTSAPKVEVSWQVTAAGRGRLFHEQRGSVTSHSLVARLVSPSTEASARSRRVGWVLWGS